MKLRIFIICLILILFSWPALGQTRKTLDRPLMVGAQYPLVFMTTTFEPDSAFMLPVGQVFTQFSYTLLNTYVYSNNSDKNNNPLGQADKFNYSGNTGYSLYFDGEINRRYLRLFYGLTRGIELHYTYRDIRFIAGHLDSFVEDFHSFWNLDNQGRQNTLRDKLEIYLQDNKTGKKVLVITTESAKFHEESATFGIKFKIRQTKAEAISLTVSSNFKDYYIERGINEVVKEKAKDHKNFNDFNYTLHYSSLFDSWSLYGAFSVAKISNSLFQDSPDELYYFFLGTNYHLSAHWGWLFQILEYSSPFPEDSTSSIGADIREVYSGFRLLMGESTAWDLGLVQNQSQGPQNIDIAFFSSLMFSF